MVVPQRTDAGPYSPVSDVGGPEAAFWRYLRNGMGKRWNAQRHEDSIGVGIPDVSYGLRNVNGWIELKQLPAWQKRRTTIVKIRHFTPQQRAWSMNRGRTGGRCFLFLKVQQEYVLLPWTEVKIDDHQTRSKMIATGSYWRGRIDFDELADALAE